MPQPSRISPKKVGRSDRYPSDYGRREKDDRNRVKTKAPIKKLLKNANVDEQGERANVRQNTPPKGFAQQALRDSRQNRACHLGTPTDRSLVLGLSAAIHDVGHLVQMGSYSLRSLVEV